MRAAGAGSAKAAQVRAAQEGGVGRCVRSGSVRGVRRGVRAAETARAAPRQ